MAERLKDKTCLIYGYGLEVEFAVKLAESFKRVYYYVEWHDAFPRSDKKRIGKGLESLGVYKIDKFWDYVDVADLICVFDTYSCDLVEYLRDKGHRVFGPGAAEAMETDRWTGREIQEQSGLPTQKYKKVLGLSALKEELKKEGDYFVKNNSRGDMETFYAKDYESVKTYIDKLSVSLGPEQEQEKFLLDKKIDGIEPGYDGFVVDGQYSNMALWGFEKKGSGYIGAVVANDKIPYAVKNINDKLAGYFKQQQTRSIFSTKLIVDKNRVGYLIDPTVRAPLPVGSALHLRSGIILPSLFTPPQTGS